MNLFDFALKEYQMIDAKANTYFSYLVFMVLLIKSMFDYKKRCDVVLGIAKKNNCKKP